MAKPGYKTTEFYTTLVTQLLAIVVSLGLITQVQADTALEVGELLLAILAALGIAGYSSAAYTRARTAVKLGARYGIE